MPPTIDPILGMLYIEPSDLIKVARPLGISSQISGFDDEELSFLIGMASRQIDSYTKTTFLGEDVSESHTLGDSWRIVPLQSPLVSLSSYRVRVGAGITQQFHVTPVETVPGGDAVRFGDIVYNPTSNYLEVTNLAVVTALVTPIIGLGLTAPIIEITYKTSDGQSIPPKVKLATAHQVAFNLSTAEADSLLPRSISRVSNEKLDIQRFSSYMNNLDSQPICKEAINLLSEYKNVFIS